MRFVTVYITLALITSVVFYFFALNLYLKGCDQCKMYNPKIENTIEGVWFNGGYYCVWTEGRNAKQINDTDTHERCHALVYQDYKHFCADS